MKHLRKSILTLLALTLFGGAGAWAQGPQVTRFTTDMLPASWENDDSDITLADLQALGFMAVDVSVAQAWTGAPQGDYAYLIYDFDEGEGDCKKITFDNGNAGNPGSSSYTRRYLYTMVSYGFKFFYTSGIPEPEAIELTKEGANQWTLGQTPDYDLELQVEYYEAHALKEIPAGWTVKVNGVPQTQPYEGDSLMITETDSVTLVPAGNPRRVKSVTLEEDVQTIIIGGLQLIGQDGDSWATIAANNQDKIQLFAGCILYQDFTKVLSLNDCDVSNYVSENSNYQASNTYQWCNW